MLMVHSVGLWGYVHTYRCTVDVVKQMRLSQHTARTSLQPDMIITSEASKHMTMLELTVPWEEQMEEANEKKCAKYQELVEEWRGRSWRTFYEPIEVGCRSHEWSRRESGCGLRGLTRVLLLGRKSGPYHPRLSRLGEGVWCCETWNTQWPWYTSLKMCPSASRRCLVQS